MKFNMPFVIGIGYICIMVGMTIPYVGKPIIPTDPIYSVFLPFEMSGVLIVPFICGYLSKEEMN